MAAPKGAGGLAANAISQNSATQNPTLGKHLDGLASQLHDIASQVQSLTAQVTSLGTELRPPTGIQSADWIQIGLLLVAILAFGAATYTFKEAKRGRDLENYLTILEKLDRYWEKLDAAPAAQKYDVFLQVVNFFESICHCYNDKLFNRATGNMLKQYLTEMIPPLYAQPQSAAWMQQAVTSAHTFSQIKKFARKNNLVGVPHQ